LAGDTLAQALDWVIRHGYILMFAAMVLEGPLTTVAGAFAAALGYFNIYWVAALSFLGNLAPDCFYFLLGHWGGRPALERFGRPLGITRARLDRWTPLAGRHAGLWLLLVKEAPLIGPTGIAIMGALGVPVRRYLGWDVAINAAAALLLSGLGFYAGRGYTQLLRYTEYHGLLLAGAGGLVLLLSFLYRRLVNRLGRRAEQAGPSRTSRCRPPPTDS
jgi:membrane protein DedA with SNARE-associated domain